MKFNLVTIFPDLINNFIEHGLFAKAINNSLIEVKTWDPREFSGNKEGRIDAVSYTHLTLPTKA